MRQEATPRSRKAADIATRFGDRDLASLAVHGLGRALIHLGRVTEGTTLLDEAMAAVIAGDVSPILAGDIYCSVLEACQETFDLRRACEWTESLAQWCADEPGLVRYRGAVPAPSRRDRQGLGEWDDPNSMRTRHASC